VSCFESWQCHHCGGYWHRHDQRRRRLALLTIGDVTIVEGNAGSTDAVFTVTLAPASGAP